MTGVGLRVAEHLVDLGARHLILLGRRAPAAPALQAIASMQERGAAVTVVAGPDGDRIEPPVAEARVELELAGPVAVVDEGGEAGQADGRQHQRVAVRVRHLHGDR